MEGTGAPRPNLKKTLRPSGKKEMPHPPLKEAVQTAKSQLTIIPFLRPYPVQLGDYLRIARIPLPFGSLIE
jgi:hypothetical protein